MIALIIIGVIVVATVTALTIQAKIAKKPSARELALGQTVRKIRDEANAYRETDPGLSYSILDIVGELEKKELL